MDAHWASRKVLWLRCVKHGGVLSIGGEADLPRISTQGSAGVKDLHFQLKGVALDGLLGKVWTFYR